MDPRFWIVCYDVRDDRRLRRVARVMEGYGRRVQKSVFECWLGESEIGKLQKEISDEIDPARDSVRYYSACADCIAVSSGSAGTEIEPLKRYYVV